MLDLVFLVTAASLTPQAVIPRTTSATFAIRLVIVNTCSVQVDRPAGEAGDVVASGEASGRNAAVGGMTDGVARVSCGGGSKAPLAVSYSSGVDERDRIVTISF